MQMLVEVKQEKVRYMVKNIYDFCPKCGALVNNGVCTSCGADYNDGEDAVSKENDVANSPENMESAAGGSEMDSSRTDNNEGDFHEENTTHIIEEQSQENTQGSNDNSGDITGTEETYGYNNPDNSYPNNSFQNGNYQNSSQQQYNYYGGQVPAGYEPTQKKKTNKALIGVLIGVIAVVIILVVYISMQVATLSKEAIQAQKDRITNSQESSDEKERDIQIDKDEKEDNLDNQNEYEQFVQYDENFTDERENHDPSTITGPYFEEFVNCIDESVSYKINREFYEEVEQEKGICIQISYIQLEGSIPNLESINETIKEESLLLAQVYLEDEEYFADNYEEAGAVYTVQVESYVTYNDEDTISIALDERYEYGVAGLLRIYGININLATGTVLDNTEILNVDEDFVNDFCKRSNAQNGKNSVGIDGISASEKLSLFQDNSSLIVFYTPIGLEVGYNYSGAEGYTGWITVSIEDYQQYLKGF